MDDTGPGPENARGPAADLPADAPPPPVFLAGLDPMRRANLGMLAGTVLGGGFALAMLALDGPILYAAVALCLLLAAHLANFVWERRFNTGLLWGLVFAIVTFVVPLLGVLLG